MSFTTSPTVQDTDVHKIVRAAYAERVKAETNKNEGGCCAASENKSCCSKVVPSASIERAADQMGYTKEDIMDAPDGSNLGLGCGAPLKPAAVKDGETVLDLGSGSGFDAFLASKVVGDGGKVIGVDMTPEMVEKAKANAVKRNYQNVDFRLGKIEALPVNSASVDVIVSNCVINLSPDKPAVFAEAFRVLKPGGRLAVSDICLTQALPTSVRNNLAAYVGCIAGASLLEDYMGALRNAGFVRVQAQTKRAFDVLAGDDPLVMAAVHSIKEGEEETVDLEQLKNTVVSATVVAYKD
jgi:arsenite methyltransferase